MIKRTVIWFDATNKGFGFIDPNNGSNNVFSHYTSIIANAQDGLDYLEIGQKVTFDMKIDHQYDFYTYYKYSHYINKIKFQALSKVNLTLNGKN